MWRISISFPMSWTEGSFLKLPLGAVFARRFLSFFRPMPPLFYYGLKLTECPMDRLQNDVGFLP